MPPHGGGMGVDVAIRRIELVTGFMLRAMKQAIVYIFDELPACGVGNGSSST
jgi:hypothetical protein